MAIPHAQYGIFIDWNDDGDFSDTEEDMTAEQLADAIVIEYGRDTARSTGYSRPGTASFNLDNPDGDLSPENPSSPISGGLLKARDTSIVATLSGTTYSLYRGDTEDFTPIYGRVARVDVTCADGLAELGAQELTSALYSGLRTGDAINIILDLAGWTKGRDIDPGQTMLPWFWLADDNALDSLQRLMDGEGMPAYYGCDSTGNFVFRDRGHRQIDAECLSVQATWRASGTEPRFSLPVTYDHGIKDVVNRATAEVGIRRPDKLAVVWSQDDAGISIQDGDTTQITVSTTDPFYDAVVPAAAVDPNDDDATRPDIDLKYGTVAVALSRTSGSVITISLTASGGPAEIQSLQLRARSVPIRYTVKVEAQDEASMAKYKTRMPQQAPDPRWASIWDVRAVLGLMVAYRAERLPVVSVPFHSGTTAILTEQLQRNLSDRVRIIYPDADLDREAFVESIRHEITGRGTDRIHKTTFTCEMAPETFGNPFVLGTSLLNGTDVLTAEGFIDPNTLMILGDNSRLLGSTVLAA